ncbi:hypothetical protein S1OALGB6SA_1951 [Olavius algarvensis spirochete endosymbiont]|nr:hypothetical protein S1OALGB6SA_1951 [Olavius algarvensis spirochete endosymbiont]
MPYTFPSMEKDRKNCNPRKVILIFFRILWRNESNNQLVPQELHPVNIKY